MGTNGLIESAVDLEQRPLLNQCATCPHMQARDYKYAVKWTVQGSEKTGMYVDEPHPCHDHVERPCVGHCADLKLRTNKTITLLSVPQDIPCETKPSYD